jgi:hypothetical protein
MKLRLTYVIFIVGIIGTIAMILYPPFLAFQYFPGGTYSAFQGYFLLFTEPLLYDLTLRNLKFPYVIKIDLIRLFLQVTAWWLVILIMCVRKK